MKQRDNSVPTGLKLLLSRVPAAASASACADDKSSSTTIPVLVIQNIGASRYSDMAEAQAVLEHFTHRVLGVDTRRSSCLLCSHGSAETHLTAEERDRIEKQLGIEADAVVHAATRDVSSTTGQQVFQLRWHYGAAFSAVVLSSDFKERTSMEPSDFLNQLQQQLSAFVTHGTRIVRGSAAVGAAPPPPDAKITTMPEKIICSVENLSPAQFNVLFIASSPSAWSPLTLLPSKSPETIQQHLPGLFLKPEFLSREWEQRLLAMVGAWAESDWQILNQRKVRHFGRRFDYSSNNVFRSEDMLLPIAEVDWIKELLYGAIHDEMKKHPALFGSGKEVEWRVDQCTVSSYDAGAGIPPHFDHVENFGELIIAVGTNAATVFEFSSDSKRYSVLFPPRALMIMQGPARYAFKHAIASRSKDFLFFEEDTCDISACSIERKRRVSFTFRRVTGKAEEQLQVAAAAAAAPAARQRDEVAE